MKKLFLVFLLPALIFCGCSNEDPKAVVVVSMESLLTTPNSEFTTTNGEADGWFMKTQFKDPQNLVEFSHYYSEYGFGGGFTYTNKTDKTTPGYLNTSAITGKGKTGTTYLTANTNSFTPARITILAPDQYAFRGAWVTNSTYAYLAIKDGNTGTDIGAHKFKTGDWFKLIAVGYCSQNNEIGRAECYLADFRNGQSYIASDWQWFDLGSIETAAYIQFEMDSSDFNENGILTPSYFCMDGITLVEK